MNPENRPSPPQAASASSPRTLVLAPHTQMGALIHDHPWETTPLGPMSSWSTTLLSMVNLILNSPFPSAVYWGREMIMIYNDPYRESLESRHPAALGRPAALVWDECWLRFGANMEAVLADGKAIVEEKVCHTFLIDGRPFKSFWNYCASPVFDGGKVVGIYKTDQNITDQVNAFNALADSDERLRLSLSGGSCIGTWDWDIKQDRLSADERFARFFGVDPRLTVAGLPLDAYFRNIHLEDHDRVRKAVRSAIETGQEYHLEYRVLQADGTVHWVCAKGRCVYGDDGEPSRFPGALFDMGPGKQAVPERRSADRASFLGDSAASAHPQPRQSDRPAIILDLGGVERDRSRRPPPLPSDQSSSPALVAFLVESIARQLVDRKDVVRVRTTGDLQSTQVILGIAHEDMPKIAGRNSRTAHSIQVVLNAAGLKRNHRYLLQVEEVAPSEAEPANEMLH